MLPERKRGFNLKLIFSVSRQTRWILAEFAAIVLLWEFAGRVLKFRPSMLPTPSRVLFELWQQSSILQLNGQATLKEIVLGLLLAVLLAAPAAHLMALFPRIHQIAAPLLLVMRRAPLLALAPVLLTWFAFGILPKILIVILLAFFPAVESTLNGLRSMPAEMTELLQTMHAGNLQILLKLRIPGSLPGFFDGVKTAVRLSVSGALVAELVAADQGLGYLMLSGISKMDVPLVFASIAILSAIAVILYAVVTLLERILIPWHVEIVV